MQWWWTAHCTECESVTLVCFVPSLSVPAHMYVQWHFHKTPAKIFHSQSPFLFHHKTMSYSWFIDLKLDSVWISEHLLILLHLRCLAHMLLYPWFFKLIWLNVIKVEQFSGSRHASPRLKWFRADLVNLSLLICGFGGYTWFLKNRILILSVIFHQSIFFLLPKQWFLTTSL